MGEVVTGAAGERTYYDCGGPRATLAESHLKIHSGGPPLEYAYSGIHDAAAVPLGERLTVVFYTAGEISPGLTFADVELGHELAAEVWDRAVTARHGWAARSSEAEPSGGNGETRA